MTRRSAVATTLVVVTCVLAPLAVSAVWVHRTVYDTDGYVAGVAPLAGDAAIQDAIVARTVGAIDRELDRVPVPDLGRLGQRVVDEARAALHRQVEHIATRLIESKQFADLWKRLNRLGHDEAVAWFSGESSRVKAEVVDDQLVVSLQPLMAEVAQRVEGIGLAGLTGDRIRHLDPKLVIVDGPLVGPIQITLRTLNDLVLVLPLLALVALVGAIIVASDRRRAVARVGIGLVIAMGGSLVVLRISREEFLDWIATTSVSGAASKAFFDTLSRGLRGAFLIGLVSGIGVVLGARFAGGRGAPVGVPPDSVATFAAAHIAGASVTLVLAGLGVLALIPGPTLVPALVVGLVVVAGVVALQIAARRGEPGRAPS